jgi:hypothetical protein
MFNPYLMHPLTAALRVLIGWVVLKFGLGVFGIHIPYPALFAMSNGMGIFEGRESGQREHDLKHLLLNPWSGFMAWVGATFYVGWTVANGLQALVGIVGAVVAGILLNMIP